MTAGNSTTELVYGESHLGLTFLEKKYALDIGRFREALAKASTWGELKARVSEERYKETIERWVENELDRLLYEGDLEENDEPEIAPPSPEDTLDAASLPGYLDVEWPEFAPTMMDTWVDKEIIEEYGGYVQPLMNDDFPVIDFDHEEKVVSLLEERGYVCLRDDDLIWKSIWGD
jgi:hypothetical protein